MAKHRTTKYKLNFKERLERLDFTRINDTTFWNDNVCMRKVHSEVTGNLWVVEENGEKVCGDKSAVACVEYLEDYYGN